MSELITGILVGYVLNIVSIKIYKKYVKEQNGKYRIPIRADLPKQQKIENMIGNEVKEEVNNKTYIDKDSIAPRSIKILDNNRWIIDFDKLDVDDKNKNNILETIINNINNYINNNNDDSKTTTKNLENNGDDNE